MKKLRDDMLKDLGKQKRGRKHDVPTAGVTKPSPTRLSKKTDSATLSKKELSPTLEAAKTEKSAKKSKTVKKEDNENELSDAVPSPPYQASGTGKSSDEHTEVEPGEFENVHDETPFEGRHHIRHKIHQPRGFLHQPLALFYRMQRCAHIALGDITKSTVNHF